MKIKLCIVLFLLMFIVSCDCKNNCGNNQSTDNNNNPFDGFKCTSEQLDIVEKERQMCYTYTRLSGPECLAVTIPKYCTRGI